MVAMATQCAQDLTLPPAQQSLSYGSYPLSPSLHDELKMAQGSTRNGLSWLQNWLSCPAMANMRGWEELVCSFVEMMARARAKHKSSECLEDKGASLQWTEGHLTKPVWEANVSS